MLEVQEEEAIGVQAQAVGGIGREIRHSESWEVAVSVPSRQLWDSHFVAEAIVLDHKVAATVTSIAVLRARERT